MQISVSLNRKVLCDTKGTIGEHSNKVKLLISEWYLVSRPIVCLQRTNNSQECQEQIRFPLSTICYYCFGLGTAIDWMFLSSQIHMLKLNPHVVLFVCGTFEKWLGHEGEALINGLSACIRGPNKLPCPFCHVKNIVKTWLSMNQEALNEHHICQFLDLGLAKLQNCDKFLLLISHPVYFYYGNWTE